MFCSKCGNQLSDGAAFCGACGNPVSQPQQTQTPIQQPMYQAPPVRPAAQQFAPQNTTSLPDGLVTIPKISEFIVLGSALLMFIFMLLPWIKIGRWSYYSTFTVYSHRSIFMGNAFDISGAIGVAKVLGIINIIVFIVFALLYFFDVKKLIPAIPEKLNLKQYATYAFGGIYALEWILTLVGMVSESIIKLSPCFVVAFILIGLFVVVAIIPGLLDKILKDVFKLNKEYF